MLAWNKELTLREESKVPQKPIPTGRRGTPPQIKHIFDTQECHFPDFPVLTSIESASGKRGLLKKGSFQKVYLLEFVESSEIEETLESIRPYSRDFRDSRDSRDEKTPFEMTMLPVPNSGPQDRKGSVYTSCIEGKKAVDTTHAGIALYWRRCRRGGFFLFADVPEDGCCKPEEKPEEKPDSEHHHIVSP